MKIQLTYEINGVFIKPLRLLIEKVHPENSTVDVLVGTAFRFNAKILSGTIEEFSSHIGKEGIIYTDGVISMTPDLLKPAGVEPFQKEYFHDTIDYPGDRAITDPIPLGVHYCYVASCYLDGFINYGEFVKAFVIGRYQTWFDLLDFEENHTININVSKTPGYEWAEKSYKNKDELFNLVTQPNAIIHPILKQHFQDDVVILKKATSATGKVQWIYFWFDMDTSDCAIGRFETLDSDEVVIQSFSKYVKECTCNYHGEREIPLHYFNGWVTS